MTRLIKRSIGPTWFRLFDIVIAIILARRQRREGL